MQHLSSGTPDSSLTVAIVGHVDHGKSTVVGRLLADTDSVPDGKLAAVAAQCERMGQRFEYAYLVDALRDERAQGITIDAARIFFRSNTRAYQIIDAPGHVEFVKNMLTGAARAQAALLVVDAEEGIRENSRRHAYLLALLGIRQVVVLVNKMDRVDFARAAFESLAASLATMLGERGVEPAHIIPVSAPTGDNLAVRSSTMPWYSGPTVLEALDAFEAEPAPANLPFRMPVQDVYKRSVAGRDRRILAGSIVAGSIAVGDEIALHPSGKRSRVATIETATGRELSARAGEAVGITLEDELYVRRGELVARGGEAAPTATTRVCVSLFWLSRTPLVPGKEYTLKLGTAAVTARLASVEKVLDTDGSLVDARVGAVGHNQTAECVLELDRAIAVDSASTLGPTARFVVVDDHEIRGGGIVRAAFALRAGQTPASARTHGSAAVVWLTGLSGAGKSTIAAWLERELARQGRRVERLDGDTIRDLFAGVGFSRAERDAHVRRVGHLASRLEHHGVIVIAAFISPYAGARDFVRALCRNFVEVHVATPIAECERRDTKGMYARARLGELERFTGVDDPYEPPANPELVLDTTTITVEEAGSAVLDRLTQILRERDGSSR